MTPKAGLEIRTTLIAVVAILSIAAWWITAYQARNMGVLMQARVPMSLGMEGGATPASFVIFTGMWLVMMVAMMLPSTYPIILLHRTVSRNRSAGPVSTLVFICGYFLTWTATGVIFYAAYVWIGSLRAHIPVADASVLRAAGIALLAAGWYQWSPSKWACLRQCQNPLHFLMEYWRPGCAGAARMGIIHGLYCFGCCWGLMTILFVMGVMHLGWMAAIGAIIVLEKMLPRRKWIPKVVGGAFMLIGAAVLVSPSLLSHLSSQVLIQ